MKKTKIIIPALGMLLLSTAASITGTVAWFSANSVVSATGMQLTVKQTNAYLLIGTGSNNTAAAIQAINPISTSVALTMSNEEAEVYPSAPADNATYTYNLTADTSLDGAKTYYAYADATNAMSPVGSPVAEQLSSYYEQSTLTEITNETTANVVGNWYTATGYSPELADADPRALVALTTFEKYVIKQTVYLTVDEGSSSVHNLQVTPSITQKAGGTDISATKILITTSDGGFAILDHNSGSVDIKGANTPLTDTTVVTVNAYIYYDGNESVVYTNNAVNLKGTNISLSFDVETI